MAERYPSPIVIDFRGGLRTDMIPQVHYEKWLQDPWFTRCENRLFEQSGAARKVGGSTRINSTAITDSPNVMGMYDFWLTGTAGAFLLKSSWPSLRMARSGKRIWMARLTKSPAERLLRRTLSRFLKPSMT